MPTFSLHAVERESDVARFVRRGKGQVRTRGLWDARVGVCLTLPANPGGRALSALPASGREAVAPRAAEFLQVLICCPSQVRVTSKSVRVMSASRLSHNRVMLIRDDRPPSSHGRDSELLGRK